VSEMDVTTVHEYLIQLRNVLAKERECAKSLDMDGLQTASQEKDALIKLLQSAQDIAPEDRLLADEIKEENRRNASLIWAALNWIRDLMGIFNRQLGAESYAPSGGTTVFQHGGRLLSGRI